MERKTRICFIGQDNYPVLNPEMGAQYVSDSEGFPNSFLQALPRSVPVASLFDPDNINRDRGNGCIPQDVYEIESDADTLLSDEPARTRMRDDTSRLVIDNCSSEAVVQTYESALNLRPFINVQ